VVEKAAVKGLVVLLLLLLPVVRVRVMLQQRWRVLAALGVWGCCSSMAS
jgi:hypothetical protein